MKLNESHVGSLWFTKELSLLKNHYTKESLLWSIAYTRQPTGPTVFCEIKVYEDIMPFLARYTFNL